MWQNPTWSTKIKNLKQISKRYSHGENKSEKPEKRQQVRKVRTERAVVGERNCTRSKIKFGQREREKEKKLRSAVCKIGVSEWYRDF